MCRSTIENIGQSRAVLLLTSRERYEIGNGCVISNSAVFFFFFFFPIAEEKERKRAKETNYRVLIGAFTLCSPVLVFVFSPMEFFSDIYKNEPIKRVLSFVSTCLIVTKKVRKSKNWIDFKIVLLTSRNNWRTNTNVFVSDSLSFPISQLSTC